MDSARDQEPKRNLVALAPAMIFACTTLVAIGGGWQRLAAVEKRQDQAEAREQRRDQKIEEIGGDVKVLLERTKPR